MNDVEKIVIRPRSDSKRPTISVYRSGTEVIHLTGEDLSFELSRPAQFNTLGWERELVQDEKATFSLHMDIDAEKLANMFVDVE